MKRLTSSVVASLLAAVALTTVVPALACGGEKDEKGTSKPTPAPTPAPKPPSAR